MNEVSSVQLLDADGVPLPADPYDDPPLVPPAGPHARIAAGVYDAFSAPHRGGLHPPLCSGAARSNPTVHWPS